MEALLLGVSTGWYCLLSCGLYLVPFLCAENNGRKQNGILLLLFMAGRLAAYMAVGAATGALGLLTLSALTPAMLRLSAVSNWLIALLLLAGGLGGSFPSFKPCRYLGRLHTPRTSALLFGILTGLALCPPFLAALVAVFTRGSVSGGISYFAWFYLGTSIYFLPLLGLSIRPLASEKVRDTARLVMLLMAGYFILKGLRG